MSTLRAVLVVSGLLGALALPATASARGHHEPVPDGSYIASCWDIDVRHDDLTATCRDRRGRAVRSEVDDIDRCVGDIANVDGRLTCTWYAEERWGPPRHAGHGPPAHAAHGPPIPAGSYLRTCMSVDRHGHTVRATCQTHRGSWVRTELRHANQCDGDIANRNGALVCEPLRPVRPIHRPQRPTRVRYELVR